MADLHPVGQAIRCATHDPHSMNDSIYSLQVKSTRSQSSVNPSSSSIHWTWQETSSSIIPPYTLIAHNWSWVVNFVAGIIPQCWHLMDLNSKGTDCSSLVESVRNTCWKNIILSWSAWREALPVASLLIQVISLGRPTGTYQQVSYPQLKRIPSPGLWRNFSSLSSTAMPFKERRIPW